MAILFHRILGMVWALKHADVPEQVLYYADKPNAIEYVDDNEQEYEVKPENDLPPGAPENPPVLDRDHESQIHVVGDDGVEDYAAEEEREEEQDGVPLVQTAFVHFEDEQELPKVQEDGRELIDQKHVLSQIKREQVLQ